MGNRPELRSCVDCPQGMKRQQWGKPRANWARGSVKSVRSDQRGFFLTEKRPIGPNFNFQRNTQKAGCRWYQWAGKIKFRSRRRRVAACHMVVMLGGTFLVVSCVARQTVIVSRSGILGTMHQSSNHARVLSNHLGLESYEETKQQDPWQKITHDMVWIAEESAWAREKRWIAKNAERLE